MIPYIMPTRDEIVSMIEFHVEMLTEEVDDCLKVNDFSTIRGRVEARQVFDELIEMKRLLAQVAAGHDPSNHLLYTRILKETADRNA